MKKNPPPSPRLAAIAVRDPDLAENDRDLLVRAEHDPRSYPRGEVSVWWATAPYLLRPGAAVVGLGIGAWVTGEIEVYTPSPHDGGATMNDSFGRPVQELFDGLHSALLPAWPIGAAVFVLMAWMYAGNAVSRNKTARRLSEIKDRCVQPSDLNDDARTLLARAQQAQKTVLTSAVQRFNLIDRQHNDVALPRQEWEIAEALREYTRLVKAEPSNPKGKVAALLDTRRRALRASLDGITRRVSALESYADQVAQADDRYRELQQIQALTDGRDDVLDLLARTARDDLAVAEIEGMTGKAAAVADAFTVALESAKEAAVIALPAR
ncbi:hypothetical protein ACIRQO_36345 [Streptomyces anulatus]|uniref:hypothetical protein n=1 Tax=Streptomyces anulatus TaxID=1892 RepID=UPI002255B6A5|nr:hypothetical protein [Streptomyces anulatus]MCX4523961.1 hypothetical protein [Streptomyces anulatus]WSU78976.1 hypothetical protein OG499_39095 [Streptomyces anulatus]